MSRFLGLAAGIVVLVLVSSIIAVVRMGDEPVKVSARFPSAVGLYEGSDVRVLGLPIGKITSVEPEGTSVRVDMEYDAEQNVPADAQAVIVPPSIVSDRYVQLTPVWTEGPVMESGSSIPLDRTAVPLELDQIYDSLNELNVALGPDGANKDGAFNDLLRVSADNLDGNGQLFNDTIINFGDAVSTLNAGSEDFFGMVRNLQSFTTELAENDEQVRSFNQTLASVADQLAGEREDLGAALNNLAIALGEISTFVRDNKENLTGNLEGLADVTDAMVAQQDALAEFLTKAPTALSNLDLAYNPILENGQLVEGTLDTRTNDMAGENAEFTFCSLILSAPGTTEEDCAVLNRLLQGEAPDPAEILPGLPGRVLNESPGGLPPLPGQPGSSPAVFGSSGDSADMTLGGILAAGR